MINLIKDDLSIVLAGEAGQGIQSIESLLTALLKKSGYNVFATKEYMSRVRGGVNSIEIRVSSKRISGFLDKIDILIPLNKESINHLQHRISKQTIVIGDKETISYNKMIDVQFSKIANEIGGALFSNTIATGLISGLLKIEEKICTDYISKYFANKPGNIINKNLDAIKSGYNQGKNLSKEINISIKKNDYVKEDLMLTGADAISLGALSGGCNYVCGYPMSPSTTVLEKMATYSKNFEIVVEQVEDEVGVVNMALGAWYAGARALVTTSGGGFALMSEGISLCGMIESPLVIHLAQRPGPATGLPTRTEQGDLNLALYAGHGEFPRIILSPGTIEEGFILSQLAFNISDKFQVPVFILTDQFFVDTYYNTPFFDLTDLKVEKFIVKTDKDYKRFLLTENGISQRGIPGFGKGNVCVDSDEHDEGGYITEDLDLRIKMVDKRLKKFKSIKKEIIKPKLIGNKNYKILIVCWGSTFNTIVESVQNLESKDIAVLHFSWIYPFPDNIEKYFNKAKQVIIIENNSTSQLGQLIKLETGFDIKYKILKYNGLPFSVEEVTKEIKKQLKSGGNNE